MTDDGKLLRVGFCVSGAGSLFRAAVCHAHKLRIQPTLLVLDHKAASDLETFATSQRITNFRLSYENRQEADRELTRRLIEADLGLICLTFDKLLPSALVDHYAGRIINVHMGLLPAFKGFRAIRQALLGGVRFFGATIHEVDKEMDNGPIVAQCIQGFRDDDTEETAGKRLYSHLVLMYLQVIAWYAQGRVYKDENGLVRVRDARYGEFPISPSVEAGFPSG
jgi:phosphoribosylglycinamide formyltransferase-1